MKKIIIMTVFTFVMAFSCAFIDFSPVDSEVHAGAWGDWSAWQDSPVTATSTREVQTRQVIESYNMESWVYTDYSSPSGRGYWPNATGNTLRAHHVTTWSKSMVDTATYVLSPGTYFNPQNTCDGLIHDATAYVIVAGQPYDFVPFFIKSENRKTQYRYRNYKSDTTPPVISNINISDIDATGYTVSCTVTDNETGVKQVKFPTWTVQNDQDDIQNWTGSTVTNGKKNGDTWSFRVNTWDHNAEIGQYLTHIYAYDKEDNSSSKSANVINVTDKSYFPSDFYSTIINTKCGKKVVVALNGDNVQLDDSSSEKPDRKRWHFVKQKNGSYAIYNMSNGYSMDVQREKKDNCTNFFTSVYHAGTNQMFYLVPKGNSVKILASHCGKSMDLTDFDTRDSANIALYDDNNSDAQTWQLSIDVGNANVSLGSTSYTYTGNTIKPTVTVTEGGISLKSDTDYNVTYSANTNAGMAKVIVTGKGNWTGSVTKNFTINKKTITSSMASSVSQQNYTGQSITPAISVKDGSTELKEGRDYTLTYNNNTNAGTAKITITGKGNYTGSVTKEFVINKKTITSSMASSVSQQNYTGQSITPAITIKDGTTDLKEGTDYTVTYDNNTNAGTAKITISGKGNYTGSVTKEFVINKKNITSSMVSTVSNQVYTGKSINPSVKVADGANNIIKDTDYAVSYSNNKEIGKAKAIITGVGNYTGKVTKNFTIGLAKTKLTGKVSKTKQKNKLKKVKCEWKKIAGAQKYRVIANGNTCWAKSNKISITFKKPASSLKLDIRAYRKVKSYSAYGPKYAVTIE